MDLNKVLIEAAKDGNMLVLKTALEKGADLNAKDENGWTALMWATENGHTEIIEYLKEKGADANITTDVLLNAADERIAGEREEAKEDKFIPQTINIYCHCGEPLQIIKINPTAVSPQLCPSCGCMYALDIKDSPLRLQIGHSPVCERPTNNDHKDVQENYYHDLLVRGEMAFLQKNYEVAGALFQKAIQLRPYEAQGYISACRTPVYLCKDFDDIRYVLEGLDMAEDIISKGISKERMNKFDGKDEIELIRGKCYQLMSHYEQAAYHYYKVLEIDPNNEEAQRLLNQLRK